MHILSIYLYIPVYITGIGIEILLKGDTRCVRFVGEVTLTDRNGCLGSGSWR